MKKVDSFPKMEDSKIQAAQREGLAEVMRAIRLKEEITKFHFDQSPAFANRMSLPTIEWKPVERRRRRRKFAKSDTRTKVPPCKISPVLDKNLKREEIVEYQPTVLPEKRKQKAKLRAELGEKNPYCTPVEGLTDKFRVALEIVDKAYKKYEQSLPLHLRPTTSHRQRAKVNEVLTRVLGSGQSILPTRNKAFEDRDQTNPTQTIPVPTSKSHAQNWRDIEFTKILTRMKLDTINEMDNNMEAEIKEYEKYKKSITGEAKRLEKSLLAAEGEATAATHNAFEEGVNVAQKGEQIKTLNKKVRELLQNIGKILNEMDDKKVLQCFEYQIAPVTWRLEHDYLNPMKEGSELQLNSLYKLKSLDEELTGDLAEDMEYLEKIIEWESCHEKHKYFTDPRQLVDTFQRAESINLKMIQSSINIQMETASISKNVAIKSIEFDQILASLQKKYESYHDMVLHEEDHCQEVLTITKLYLTENNTGKELLAKKLARIYASAKQTFSSIFDKDSCSFSSLPQLLAEIEIMYVSLLEEIDFMPQKYVQDLKANIILEEQQYIQRDKLYRQRMEEFEKLTKRLHRAMAPPPNAEGRRLRILKARSAPPLPRPPKLPFSSKSSDLFGICFDKGK